MSYSTSNRATQSQQRQPASEQAFDPWEDKFSSHHSLTSSERAKTERLPSGTERAVKPMHDR
ncbi:MAG TPA: hypothetical protein VGN60_08130 [Devosia sp.]|jgi:hypothetical protein|nr:hypothetical protein [Devosia sp.]